jgi:ubiquinol-cytochrome c reductase cytochrome b subunit
MFASLMGWVDARFPATKMYKEHLSEYYAPKNFNFWYFFGSLALLVLVLQIVTGIFLTMNYKPDAELAFASVEYIMRDVEWGWLIRYLHSTGASAFFVVIYLHMFRGLIYGSYKQPRELVWIFGMFLYLALMAEAFMGYLLPWGQMSYWGAQVIISLFGAIPFIGEQLALWIRGDFVVGEATLNRFFAFHVIAIPFAIVGLVAAHIIALHEVGSNNPDGVDIKKNKDSNGIPLDGIPFHPYYTVKDIVGVTVFLFIFSLVLFYAPEMGGYFLEPPNFVPADPLKTPEHIAPVWYFTPSYAILRAIPSINGSAFPGVVGMGLSIALLFLLPWLDRSPIRSIRYRGPLFRTSIILFIVSFIFLGYLGTQSSSENTFGINNTLHSQVFTGFYFAFFFLMPLYTSVESDRELTKSIRTALLALGLVMLVAGHFVNYFVFVLGAMLLIIGVLLHFCIKIDKNKQVPERVTMK